MAVAEWVKIWDTTTASDGDFTSEVDIRGKRYENVFVKLKVAGSTPTLGTATKACLVAQVKAFAGDEWSVVSAAWSTNAITSSIMLLSTPIVFDIGAAATPSASEHPWIMPLGFHQPKVAGGTTYNGSSVAPHDLLLTDLGAFANLRFMWALDANLDSSPEVWVGLVKYRNMA